eukprot:105463-Chlamydomonas_euryale.AAC.1
MEVRHGSALLVCTECTSTRHLERSDHSLAHAPHGWSALLVCTECTSTRHLERSDLSLAHAPHGWEKCTMLCSHAQQPQNITKCARTTLVHANARDLHGTNATNKTPCNAMDKSRARAANWHGVCLVWYQSYRTRTMQREGRQPNLRSVGVQRVLDATNSPYKTIQHADDVAVSLCGKPLRNTKPSIQHEEGKSRTCAVLVSGKS